MIAIGSCAEDVIRTAWRKEASVIACHALRTEEPLTFSCVNQYRLIPAGH